MKPIKLPIAGFLFAGILLLLVALALISYKKTTLINLRDTAIATPLYGLFLTAAIALLVIWGSYQTIGKFLYSPTLTWLHLLTTILPLFLLLALFSFTNQGMPSTPRRYIDIDNSQISLLSKLVSGLFWLLLLAQLVYSVNFLLGFFAKKPGI
ncbi:MAG TPA: hypothetical protein PLQ32_10545 [Flavihumibacter sp.]|nr:hypothetical protein [Bacteroidota bacterium]HOA37285.1 hypothetical protein [Flavihumibacter sp.]HPZ88534.1 hypothetical protein [Flavihumibacter sp.]HQD09387.1 hypothetical protein [Flavihumibacter sp.]